MNGQDSECHFVSPYKRQQIYGMTQYLQKGFYGSRGERRPIYLIENPASIFFRQPGYTHHFFL
jgi:hypothetical protein